MFNQNDEVIILNQYFYIINIMSSLKRHFTAVIGKKEQGTYVSSSPSSAARKAVSKLCADDKKRKVEFYMRETTQGSIKKVYGL